MKQLGLLIFLLLFIFGCRKYEKQQKELSFVEKIQNAHQKEKFNQEEAIQFDLKLSFGGEEKIKGKVTLVTNSSKGKITFSDGNTIIYHSNKVYYSPGLDSTTVRFNAFTWSYFFLLPYKLNDKGTKWESYKNKEKDSKNYLTEKLLFAPQTGDAPDDWYVVYADINTNLIQKAAYIVTAFGSKKEAEKNPHAIQYSNYKEINAIPIATQWKFWEWNKNDGLAKQIGEATITSIEFIKNDSSLFLPSNNLKLSN